MKSASGISSIIQFLPWVTIVGVFHYHIGNEPDMAEYLSDYPGVPIYAAKPLASFVFGAGNRVNIHVGYLL
jgi:hypothetical protein